MTKSYRKNKVHFAFWTGGWDSTYMVIKLLRSGCTVQPIYLINPRRKSRKYELASLDKLSKSLQCTEKEGTLLPYLTFSVRNIAKNPKITASFESIRRQQNFGTQYEYLARFAAEHHAEFPVIALGVEKVHGVNVTGCNGAIQKFGQLTTDFRIDQKNSTAALVEVLGNFEFPIIMKDDNEMLADIKKWGMAEAMKDIWFCHQPIKGEPCGCCAACRQKIAKGELAFLLPERALNRYEKFCVMKQRWDYRTTDWCRTILHLFNR